MSKIVLEPLSKKIDKIVNIAGSKSYTNRALIMASLCEGSSELHNYSLGTDSLVLIQALKKIGVKIKQTKKTLFIEGTAGKFKSLIEEFDMGAAGTSSRFLIALAALIPGKIIIDGSSRLQQRPVKDLVEALIDLGTEISYLNKEDFLPIEIRGGKIINNTVSMKGAVSSQYFTALMLIAPLFKNGLTINVKGQQISKSYIDMTIGALKDFGIKVENKNYKQYCICPGQKYQSTNYQIEIDASGSSYFFAIAAITGSKIRINNITSESFQGDAQFPFLLKKMGCIVNENKKENWIEVEGSRQLKSVEVNMESMPDTAQTLAIIAAFARGKTKITGLSTLKNKETDRLSAIYTELSKIGIYSKISNDSIEIIGGNPVGATIKTYKDHRMAMSFALAGSKIFGIEICNPDVVDKSFPNFWQSLKKLGVNIKEV